VKWGDNICKGGIGHSILEGGGWEEVGRITIAEGKESVEGGERKSGIRIWLIRDPA